MSNRFLNVEYDPVSAKLYAERKIQGVVNVLPTSSVETISGSTYALSVKDAEKLLVFNNVDATLQITSQNFLLGTKIRQSFMPE